MLTEGEGAPPPFSGGEDGVLGGALQRLAVVQLGAVQRQRQAVSHARLVDAPFLPSASVVMVYPPGQVGGGVRSKPGAGGVEVVGVRCRSPHALWVSVWDVCGGTKASLRKLAVLEPQTAPATPASRLVGSGARHRTRHKA